MAEFPGLYANVAQSTIATTALAATDGSVALSSGDGAKFPSSAPFLAYIGVPSYFEIVRVTARSSDTLTITRGQEGTQAKAFAIGVAVYLYQSEGTGDLWGIGALKAGNIGTLQLLGNTAVATGAAGTITTAGLGVSRVNPAADRTACVLQAGTVDGQMIIVENVSATHSVTFDIAGTSNVADGVSSSVAALTAVPFVWNSTTSLWYRVV